MNYLMSVTHDLSRGLIGAYVTYSRFNGFRSFSIIRLLSSADLPYRKYTILMVWLKLLASKRQKYTPVLT